MNPTTVTNPNELEIRVERITERLVQTFQNHLQPEEVVRNG